MTERYVVELTEHDKGIVLYENIEGVLTQIDVVPMGYAVDTLIANEIRKAIQESTSPFMVAGSNRAFYKIQDDLGEVIKVHCKVYSLLSTLYDKLLYIDRTQFFTLLSNKNYTELLNRLNIYYLTTKIEGKKEGE